MTVIILIIIAVLLILLNINAIRKENKSFSQALDNKSKNITEYELELGKLRKEFAETILELQKEIEALKASINDNDTKNDEEWTIDRLVDENFKEESEIDTNFTETYNKAGKRNNNEKNHSIKYEDENIINSINKTDEKDENNKRSYKSVKLDEISSMLEEGLSIDEIAEKVGMGKGEVLLIKELYIK